MFPVSNSINLRNTPAITAIRLISLAAPAVYDTQQLLLLLLLLGSSSVMLHSSLRSSFLSFLLEESEWRRHRRRPLQTDKTDEEKISGLKSEPLNISKFADSKEIMVTFRWRRRPLPLTQ